MGPFVKFRNKILKEEGLQLIESFVSGSHCAIQWRFFPFWGFFFLLKLRLRAALLSNGKYFLYSSAEWLVRLEKKMVRRKKSDRIIINYEIII